MSTDCLSVEVYAGYPGIKGEPTPRAFVHGGLRREVTRMVEAWYTETHSCFRVCADEDRRYVVRYEFVNDRGGW